MTSASCNAAKHGKNDDYDDEGSDFSPSLHKKEMLAARHYDGLEVDRSYSDDSSNGPPDLTTSSGDDDDDKDDQFGRKLSNNLLNYSKRRRTRIPGQLM